jgi:pyruvate formate lyase activating enzyme
LNNADDTIKQTAEFIKTLPNKQYIKGINLLPYHKLGVGKYAQLGLKYVLQNKNIDNSKDQLETIKSNFEKYLHGLQIPISVLEH